MLSRPPIKIYIFVSIKIYKIGPIHLFINMYKAQKSQTLYGVPFYSKHHGVAHPVHHGDGVIVVEVLGRRVLDICDLVIIVQPNSVCGTARCYLKGDSENMIIYFLVKVLGKCTLNGRSQPSFQSNHVRKITRCCTKIYQ